MKNINIVKSFILLIVASNLSACDAVAGIFNAGMNFGIFIAIAVAVLLIFVVMRLFKRKNP